MNDDITGVAFSEWVLMALTAPAEFDSYGEGLTGNNRVTCDGLKKLVRLVAEWMTTNNAMDVPWHYKSKAGLYSNGGSIAVVLRVTHHAETHYFYMDADWVTNTTNAYKPEDVNGLPLEATLGAAAAA